MATVVSKRNAPSETTYHQLHVSHSINKESEELPEKDISEETHTHSQDKTEAYYTRNDEEQETETSADDIMTTVNKLQKEIKEFFSKWLEEFSASEKFELLCPSRIDELLKEAYALENDLKEQKQQLKEQLKLLTSTLDMTDQSI